MYFINLILFVIAAYFLSLLVKEGIELILPAFTALWLVMLYGLAIFGYAHHSFHLSILLYIAVYIAYVVKNRRLFPDVACIKESLLSRQHIGFFVYIAAVILAFYCYSNHVVNVWDDFHYNATFPKNMFYFGTMPYGYQSTTGYKDYFPTQQLFFYWGFQSAKRFSEAMMFQYKLFLAYTFTLPIFNQINSGKIIKRTIATLVAVIIPYMCLFEIMESLSMDTVLALLFANALYGILRRDKSLFGYSYIAIMLMALVLYKSYALVFACISIAAWFLCGLTEFKSLDKAEKIKETVYFGLSSLATLACFVSWKFFCKTHGNTTYLSDILSDNIEGGGIDIPDYAVATIKNIFSSLFCMRLNFGKLSLTVFSAVVIYLIIIAIMVMYKKYTKYDLAADVMILAGLVGYVLFLMYTFVFIFEQWEAESLSSLDRYLGTYTLVIMFIAAYRCLSIVAERDLLPAVVFSAICAISLNYGFISNSLIPDNYAKSHKEIIDTRNSVSAEIDRYDIRSLGPVSVVLVSDEEDTLYMRSMQYECIPLHAYQFVITSCEEGEEAKDLFERANDTGSDFILVTEHAAKYSDEIEALNELCDSNVYIEGSGLYRFDREIGKVTGKVK